MSRISEIHSENMPYGVNAGGKTPAEAKSMFAAAAPRYDLLNRILSLGLDQRWRKRAAREAEGIAGGAIADLCTGTGDMALALARATPPAVRILCVDFCEEMLALARKKFSTPELEKRAEFLIGDASVVPLPDSSVQLAAMAFGLRNLSDPMQAVNEMARIVLPGGKAVILEFTRPRGFLFGVAYRLYFHGAAPVIGRLLSRNSGDAYRYLPRSVERFDAEVDIMELMRRAGLRNVSAFPLTSGAVAVFVGKK